MKVVSTQSSTLLLLWTCSFAVLDAHAFQQLHPISSSRSASIPTSCPDIAPSASTTSTSLSMVSLFTTLRGGATIETATAAITKSLTSTTPVGVLGLTAVAVAVVTPLTIYKQAYAFSVAYGMCVAAMGSALLLAFDLTGTSLSLASALVFYGIRLAAHLLLREVTLTSKREQLKTFDKTPRLKRIPFSVSVALFYAFMVTPALAACKATGLGVRQAQIATFGSFLAWIGAVVEAWTDAQKFWAKRGKDGAIDFHGPSSWWYGVSRHPNYLGEILFWAGVFVAGLPGIVSSGKVLYSMLLGSVSALGLTGIVGIMLSATKRLEGKQDEKYGGQLPFEQWKAKTGALVPKINLVNLAMPLLVSVGGAYAAAKYVPSLLLSKALMQPLEIQVLGNVVTAIAVSYLAASNLFGKDKNVETW